MLLAAFVLCCAHAVPLRAADFDGAEIAALFPDATGELKATPLAGTPPIVAVSERGQLVGYAFSTRSMTGSVGYGGKPIDIHVGLKVDGHIAGARLVAHEEPILVIGVAPQALEAFVAGLAGLDIRQATAVPTGGKRPGVPDHIAGATVSSNVIKDAVLRSARAVAAAHGLMGASATKRRIDVTSFTLKGWQQLEAEGAIGHLRLTQADVGLETSSGAQSPFIDLYVALLTPPTIGQSLLGQRSFERLQGQLAADAHAVLIAGSGLYSFKGTEWRRSGVFDRVQIEQGATTIALLGKDHENIERLAVGDQPELREIGIFRIAPGIAFDPARPWRLTLLVEPPRPDAAARARLVPLDYHLPSTYLAPAKVEPDATDAVLAPSPRATELWVDIWHDRKLEIAVTIAMLVILSVILFTHDLLVRNVRRYRITRLVFLVVTVLFLGFYAGAQLSIVHVIAFSHAVLSGFKWDQFLLDPLSFILWAFVALCLLFWGRGVFCGWLCPFGALQELLNEAARRLGVRQIELPWPLHERLWPIKYVAFLVILGVSFKSATQAFAIAEIEPFKTTIALKFVRAWPYLLYAMGLLAAGLFIERFYCRYLCPLGAALAIPARLRLFEWLKRRPQCGRECRICATRCTVQAINPLGAIVPNECIYCLQCQANYYDAKTCLPLIQRSQRRAGIASKPALTAPENDDG